MNKSLRKSVGQNLKKNGGINGVQEERREKREPKNLKKKKMKDQNFLNLMKDINIPM